MLLRRTALAFQCSSLMMRAVILGCAILSFWLRRGRAYLGILGWLALLALLPAALIGLGRQSFTLAHLLHFVTAFKEMNRCAHLMSPYFRFLTLTCGSQGLVAALFHTFQAFTRLLPSLRNNCLSPGILKMRLEILNSGGPAEFETTQQDLKPRSRIPSSMRRESFEAAVISLALSFTRLELGSSTQPTSIDLLIQAHWRDCSP